MATITGVAGTSILASCTVENYGAQIKSSDDAVSLQAVCNDLATISTGNCTIAGNKTFTGTNTVAGTMRATGAGVISASSGGTIAVRTGSLFTADSGSQANLYGQIRIPTPVILADRASITDYLIGAETGNIILIKSQSSGFTFVLKVTSNPPPVDGDWIRFVCAESASPTGNTLSFKSEGASAGFVSMVKGVVEVRYTSGVNAWVLVGFGAPDSNMSFSATPPLPY
jgi:hypothetical protein